jgi:hypothetical protein
MLICNGDSEEEWVTIVDAARPRVTVVVAPPESGGLLASVERDQSLPGRVARTNAVLT